jgi:hypothetical protein
LGGSAHLKGGHDDDFINDATGVYTPQRMLQQGVVAYADEGFGKVSAKPMSCASGSNNGDNLPIFPA